jgi:hypothetical protein
MTPPNGPLDRDLAIAAVAAGTRRYFADRRARVVPFIDRHFTLRGVLAIHRAALGWDIPKAPLNLFLAAPQVVARLAAMLAEKAGAPRIARVLRRPILLPTAVGRRIEWLVYTDLLQLPFRQGGRVCDHDALAEAILADPAVTGAIAGLLADHARDLAFRESVRRAVAEYKASRAAAAEITTGLVSLSAGAAVFNKLTPGAASLGPTLAGLVAQQAAVASFPLGGWLGGVWYGVFPAAPSVGLLIAITGALVLTAATFAAFAGILADPLQRLAGLHRVRLLRMIAALERQLTDPAAPGFAVRDHYVARLLDLFDLIAAAVRLAKP